MYFINSLISILSAIVVGGWLPPLIGIFLLGMFSSVDGDYKKINTLKYTFGYGLFLAVIEVIAYMVTGVSNFTPLAITFVISSIFVLSMHFSLSRSK